MSTLGDRGPFFCDLGSLGILLLGILGDMGSIWVLQFWDLAFEHFGRFWTDVLELFAIQGFDLYAFWDMSHRCVAIVLQFWDLILEHFIIF